MISPIERMIDEACSKSPVKPVEETMLDVVDAAKAWYFDNKFEGTDVDNKLCAAVQEWIERGG